MNYLNRLGIVGLFVCSGVVAAPIAGCSGGSNPSDSGGPGDTGSVPDGGGGSPSAARGQYLVDNVLICGACHTPAGADGRPDMTRYLAGSRSYDFNYTPPGGSPQVISVYAENLTSDPDQGIGMWSDDEVRGAITHGVDDVGVALWPIMPYPEYSMMTPDDVTSIIMYLRTVPPSTNTVPPDTLADPDPAAMPIALSQIPQTTLAASNAAYPSAQRGRYIAAVACVNCHTPETAPGIPNLSLAFAGGRTFRSRSDLMPSTSTNLTPDATGLAMWSVADIVASIQTNTERATGRALCDAMPGGPHRLGDMTAADLQDVATYIHSLAPIMNGPFRCTP